MEDITAEKLAKDITANANVNVKNVNIDVSWNVINNLGLTGAIIGKMKISTSLSKSGPPAVKAGFAIGVV